MYLSVSMVGCGYPENVGKIILEEIYMQSCYVGNKEIGESFVKLRIELVNKLVSFYSVKKLSEQSSVGVNTKGSAKRFSVDKFNAEIVSHVLQEYATDFCKEFGCNDKVDFSYLGRDLESAISFEDSSKRKAEFTRVLDGFFMNLCSIAANFKAKVGSEKFEGAVKECNKKLGVNLRFCGVFGAESLKLKKAKEFNKTIEKESLDLNEIKQRKSGDLSHLFGPGPIPKEPKDLSHLFGSEPIKLNKKSTAKFENLFGSDPEKQSEPGILWDWDNCDNLANSSTGKKNKNKIEDTK